MKSVRLELKYKEHDAWLDRSSKCCRAINDRAALLVWRELTSKLDVLWRRLEDI